MGAHAQTLDHFSGYGTEQDSHSKQSPRLGFQFGAGARVVSFEALGETPRLGWLDRIVRVVNSAILE